MNDATTPPTSSGRRWLVLVWSGLCAAVAVIVLMVFVFGGDDNDDELGRGDDAPTTVDDPSATSTDTSATGDTTATTAPADPGATAPPAADSEPSPPTSLGAGQIPGDQAGPEGLEDTGGCDPNYEGACVPVFPAPASCESLGVPGILSTGSDPHGLDPDSDGLACN